MRVTSLVADDEKLHWSGGPALSSVAQGAVVRAARQLLAEGAIDPLSVDGALLRKAFTD